MLFPSTRRLATGRRFVATVAVLLAVLDSAVSLPAMAAEASLLTASGETLAIEVESIHEGQLTATMADGTGRTWSTDDLSQIRFEVPPQTGPVGRAGFAGGSIIAIESAVMEEGQDSVRLQPRRQSPLTVPLRRVRSIRFAAPTPATDSRWLGLLEEPPRGDRLVVRRDEATLESVEGTVTVIGREAITFELSGNSVEAPLTRLEGVIFGGGRPAAPEAAVRVTDQYGSLWAAEQIALPRDSDELVVGLGDGLEHTLPLSQVRSIEFTGGILMLAQADIAATRVQTAADIRLDEVQLTDWFGPRAEGGTIEMRAPGEITFRVPEGFQRFVGAVRRSLDVEQFSPVPVQVLLDGEVVWTMTLTDRSTLGFELPLGQARRISLRMGDEQGLSVGDCVDWIGGRLLK